MPTVGTILDLLPWVIFAPALPLLFILINKAYGNGRQTSLVLLCVITIFTNIFLLLAARSSVEPRFLHVSFVADFLFTFIASEELYGSQNYSVQHIYHPSGFYNHLPQLTIFFSRGGRNPGPQYHGDCYRFCFGHIGIGVTDKESRK
jgi:hypothetical protein